MNRPNNSRSNAKHNWQKNSQLDYKKYKQHFIPIRLSHLLRHCSVGSIVRTPDYLLTIQDIRRWNNERGEPAGLPIYYVEQVKAALGIDKELRQPPIAQLDKDNEPQGYWIPAQRFPSWTHCSKCGLLHYQPWQNKEKGSFSSPFEATTHKAKPELHQCSDYNCRGKLEQVTLVQVHADGYLFDLPWHSLIHSKTASNANTAQTCKSDIHMPSIKWDRKNRKITCIHCRKSSSVAAGQKLPFYGWIQPWIKQQPDWSNSEPASPLAGQEDSVGTTSLNPNLQSTDSQIDDNNKTNPLATIMEVNDTRVHTPINKIALVIPPESRIKQGSVVDRLYCKSDILNELNRATSDLETRSLTQSIAARLNCSVQEFKEAQAELKKGYPLYGKTFSSVSLLLDEYNALLDNIPDLQDDEDFVTHHFTEDWLAFTQARPQHSVSYKLGVLINQVISVAKLKEILVFTGFTRGGEGAALPAQSSDNEMATDTSTNSSTSTLTGLADSKTIVPAKSNIVPPDIVGETSWYPALELYGEGIFITLDETVLNKWESHPAVEQRTQVLKERYAASATSNNTDIIVTPRFLLLHAISHLLIKELETQAGYPAASLKEKIYSAEDVEDPMSGILIYVAIPDVDGSLGGLAELAEPQRLILLLVKLFEKAQWCSLDPVCSGHQGQGPALLNLAACHACLLLPETSCCCGNSLLDRLLVRGDINQSLPGILEGVL